jgi:hypothetical protein
MKAWLPPAWAQIQLRRYSDALKALDHSVYSSQVQPERQMARSVWLGGRRSHSARH